MEYSLKNLEKIVQKKADDAFIKSIIRKYINIDIEGMFWIYRMEKMFIFRIYY